MAATIFANGNSNTKTSVKGKSSEMKISIQIQSDNGNYSLTATLEDNSSAKAFYELLKKAPLTIKMNEYGGFEKVGSLGTNIPRNDTQIKTAAGEIFLYNGNQITIFYNSNSWSYTRLGKIDGKSQAELKSILGKGDVTSTFTIL